jgi:hypothetical protein
MKASLQSADVSVRLRRDSTSVSLTLGSLEAEDLCSPGSTFSRIVCPKVRASVCVSMLSVCFSLLFEVILEAEG